MQQQLKTRFSKHEASSNITTSAFSEYRNIKHLCVQLSESDPLS